MTAHTDPGRVRSQNQDTVHTNPRQQLFVLADGVGGRAGGAVASRLAVDTIRRRMRRARGWRRLIFGRARTASTLDTMAEAVEIAHQALHARVVSRPDLQGMSCTVVAGSLENDHCTCVAVGDSRLYHYHEGQLQQITRDQTLAAQLLEEGFLEPGDQRLEQYQHMLTAVVGGDTTPPVQRYRIPFGKDDLLLACSDGLSGMLSNEQITHLIAQPGTLDELADRLVAEANQAGGRDNISVILIGRETPARAQSYSTAKEER